MKIKKINQNHFKFIKLLVGSEIYLILPPDKKVQKTKELSENKTKLKAKAR